MENTPYLDNEMRNLLILAASLAVALVFVTVVKNAEYQDAILDTVVDVCDYFAVHPVWESFCHPTL